MKTLMSFFMTILFATTAHPQSSAEVTCRAQAKEAAVQTYSSCITAARNSRVEQIRNEYQSELAALKSKYDKELKSLSGKNSPVSSPAPQSPRKSAKAKALPPKANKGISTELPVRSITDAEPVQSVSEGMKVVTTENSEGSSESASSDALEKEAAEADQVEFIEMPVE